MKVTVQTGAPFRQFAAWFAEASAAEPGDPNAMTVATVTPDGQPSARIVLMKSWDDRGFVFYTNLASQKSREIYGNAQVALLFHWKSLNRQVRIEGAAAAVEPGQADAYFQSRPRISRLGAWASRQSAPLPSRAEFESRVEAMEARFPGDDIPRPDFWSGWRIKPQRMEFWTGAEFRLHDRTVFLRSGDDWESEKLYP